MIVPAILIAAPIAFVASWLIVQLLPYLISAAILFALFLVAGAWVTK